MDVQTQTDLRIERIDAARAEEFGRVASGGFGLPAFTGEWLGGIVGRPGWHCYLALAGDRPVACAVLYATGDIGWLGIGAALPEFRGRGAQSALLAARIRDGAELGVSDPRDRDRRSRGGPAELLAPQHPAKRLRARLRPAEPRHPTALTVSCSECGDSRLG